MNAIELKVYGHTLDNEDDFKSVCTGVGIVELDVIERCYLPPPSHFVDINGSVSTIIDGPVS